MWEFHTNKKVVNVFHAGLHTCHATAPRENAAIQHQLEEDFKKHTSLKPSEAASNTIVAALKKDDSTWEEIELLADTLADTRRIRDTKAKVKRSMESYGHSFDAVGEFKKFCDKRDPYLVYRSNDGQQNGDLTYVFKCSRFQAQLALSMDCSKDGLLREQYCYASFLESHPLPKWFRVNSILSSQ